MAIGIGLIQLGVGERKLGRRKVVALSSSVSDPINQGAVS
jgi:iron(III) transport system permease protein